MPTAVKFIIGKNRNGRHVEVSCEPKKMYAYKNKQYLFKSDPYLTRVAFRKEVLDKYYGNPDSYSVKDGVLWIKNMFYMPIDNNHKSLVIVFLGDLHNLPLEEQHHWRSFNIFQESPRLSNVALLRNFYCEYTDPDSEDLLFKNTLNSFNENFQIKYGWPLFRPLNTIDIHNLKSLAKLSYESQKQFDEGILRLAKILVDSINVKEINKLIDFNKEEKSIDKLEKYFLNRMMSNSECLIKCLRLIQKLRSEGSAHRKGSDYPSLVDKFKGNSLQEKFSQILKDVIESLKNVCI